MHTQLRGYAKPVTAAPTPAPGEVATQTVHAADEDAAALWRVEAGQAREGGQEGDDRDGEPHEMEEGDDYHIWLRNPQAGFGEETDEAEIQGTTGTWRARASGAMTRELRTVDHPVGWKSHDFRD
mmetsp:Transcript_11067/g.29658  ORF Transcript_11067/g.29658 Transcript_11067/m.29658 type:complete len:125 (-) Transcript_11067:56-430(-)